MQNPLYMVLASKINALNNCVKAGNDEWYGKHKEVIEELVKVYFPHGSGIDGSHGEFDYEKCNDHKLIFCSEYHFMNENGMYDGWYDFKVIVESSLQSGFNIDVKTHRKMREHGVDDYLADCYHEVLKTMVDEYPSK